MHEWALRTPSSELPRDNRDEMECQARGRLGISQGHLVRQHASASFHCEGNDQQTDPKGNRGKCDGLAESPHSADQGSHSEVHSRDNEASKRSREGKCGRTNRGSVLLRQPKAEDSEVAAKEA